MRRSTSSAIVSRSRSGHGSSVGDNDFVLISFVGKMDGEEYQGNTVDKYLYEMGKGLMPEEFEDALLGVSRARTSRLRSLFRRARNASSSARPPPSRSRSTRSRARYFPRSTRSSRRRGLRDRR